MTSETAMWIKPDWWTALATVALVVVGLGQLVLFYFQLRYIRRSLHDAKVSADAARDSADGAKISADIARKMDRAFVTAEVTAPMLALSSAGREWVKGGRTMVSATVTLRNHGRTPAIIRKVDAGLRPLSSRPTKPLSFSPKSQHLLPPALAIAAKNSYPFEARRPLIRSVWQDTVSGKKTLFCGGTIVYDDVLGQQHETAFCWERSSESDGKDRYSITYSEDLNYFRSIPTSSTMSGATVQGVSRGWAKNEVAIVISIVALVISALQWYEARDQKLLAVHPSVTFETDSDGTERPLGVTLKSLGPGVAEIRSITYYVDRRQAKDVDEALRFGHLNPDNNKPTELDENEPMGVGETVSLIDYRSKDKNELRRVADFLDDSLAIKVTYCSIAGHCWTKCSYKNHC
jgi:hypothetical protein